MTVADNNTFTFDLNGVLAKAQAAYKTYRDAVRAEEEARQQAAQEAGERDIDRFYEWLNEEMGPEMASLVRIPQGFRWDDLNYFWSSGYEHKRGVQFAIDLPDVMPVHFRVYRSSRDDKPEFVTLDEFGQYSNRGHVWSVPTRVDFERGEEEDEIWPTYSAPVYYERHQLLEAVGHALTTKPFVEAAMAEFKERAAMPTKSTRGGYQVSNQYFVMCTEVVECATCEGTGWVMHPAWARYWSELGEEAARMGEAEDLAWFRNHYGEWFNTIDDLPSEEVVCPDCDGKRERTYQVDLFTALRDLNAATTRGGLT